jgi:putative sterol carrier protein
MSLADEVKKILDKMPEAVAPEKVNGVNATIQLQLTGEGAGDWILNIINGTISVRPGQASAPDLTLGMEASDYVALAHGQINPVNLFMAGKIKLQGDMGLAMKFPEMFNRA